MKLAEKCYHDFNDVHFSEVLAEEHGIRIGRETLRRILRASGRSSKRKRRAKKHHKRRERFPSKGLMLLWDGSQHRWFGPHLPICTLMAAIFVLRDKVIVPLVDVAPVNVYLSAAVAVQPRP